MRQNDLFAGLKAKQQEIKAGLADPEVKELFEKFAKSEYKFKYYKQIFIEIADSLKLHNQPVSWTLGICYNVYLAVKHKAQPDLPYNYIKAIAAEEGKAAILNELPPRFPEQNNALQNYIQERKYAR